MPVSIYPCLWLNGQAREAADFYMGLFKDSTLISENHFVTLFSIEGKTIMAMNGGPMFSINPAISMMVSRVSKGECKRLWDHLSVDGKVLMPLNKYPWSEYYGWIQDRFGFSWQIMLSGSDKLVPSMLFTGVQMGKAVPAMEFYTALFPESGIDFKNYYADDSPFASNINYAEFHLANYSLVAMDGPNEHGFTFSEGVSMVVNCKNQEEIDLFWKELTSNGGQESQCGWCKDQFGLSWQIVPHHISQLIGDSDKGKRATQVLFTMKKIDIKALENA